MYFLKAVHFGANGVQIQNHSFIQRKLWNSLANALHVMPVRNLSSGAISLTDGEMKINRERCMKCFRCTEVCYAEAKELIGQEITPEEIFKEVNKDRFFLHAKGGGVTFSGGEPLTQPDLLAEAAALCRKNRIHTVIETCGAGNYEEFKKSFCHILMRCF